MLSWSFIARPARQVLPVVCEQHKLAPTPPPNCGLRVRQFCFWASNSQISRRLNRYCDGTLTHNQLRAVRGKQPMESLGYFFRQFLVGVVWSKYRIMLLILLSRLWDGICMENGTCPNNMNFAISVSRIYCGM